MAAASAGGGTHTLALRHALGWLGRPGRPKLAGACDGESLTGLAGCAPVFPAL